MIKVFKHLFVLILTVLFFVGMIGQVQAQKHYADIKYPKLNEIKVPKVEQVTLSNGMKLFLLEDHELPLVNLSARIRVGSTYDPEDKRGLASITGQVMRTGGTKKRTGDEIDEILEGIAASVETSIGLNSGTASMSVLKKDFETGLSILADVLMNPEFREDKIDLAKVQERSTISRRNDNVNALAQREFVKLIYGSDSPYARHTEYETVDKIARADLVAFHRTYYHPNNVMLGVWGDFKSSEVVKQIEGAFAGWDKTDIAFPAAPKVDYQFRQTVNLVEKNDVNQTNLVLGHIGGQRDDPDYFALILMNRILGQGFSSRLFRNVRSQEGLAYSVFGTYTANYNYPGVLFVGCQTKSETTVQATRSMLRQVKSMTQEEVTDEELAIAKDSYLNSFVFNFDTKGEVVNRLMTYSYYGYPSDFLQKTKASVEKVSKADILRVARKHLHADQMQILAVGKPADFDEELSVLGSVNNIDITIPVVEEEAPEATEATLTKGREVLGKAIAACGGVEAFQAIKTVQQKGNLTIVTPQGEMSLQADATIAFPDRLRVTMKTPMGDVSQVMNGTKAWMVSPQGTQPAPREQLISSLWQSISYLFAHSDTEGLTAQHLGEADVSGQACEIVLITPPQAKSFKLFISAQTNMPVKMDYQGMNFMGAPVASEQSFLDFREVGGVKLPFKSVTLQDGKPAQEGITSEILINVSVDESLFSVKE
jgi:predicted Zn-dependent peptidase